MDAPFGLVLQPTAPPLPTRRDRGVQTGADSAVIDWSVGAVLETPQRRQLAGRFLLFLLRLLWLTAKSRAGWASGGAIAAVAYHGYRVPTPAIEYAAGRQEERRGGGGGDG